MSDRRKTSSGHSAGIQSTEEFAENERRLKRQRQEEMASMPDIKNTKTVYRNKSGEQIDMESEYLKKTVMDKARSDAIEEAQYEWGKGAAQKQDREDAIKEAIRLSGEGFARYNDNEHLEKIRKNVIHADDPMAAFMKNEKLKKTGPLKSRTGKPLYNGPTPPPNRFGILPGYRWDAVNRANGFEHKILTRMNDKKSYQEDEYKWSVSDL